MTSYTSCTMVCVQEDLVYLRSNLNFTNDINKVPHYPLALTI